MIDAKPSWTGKSLIPSRENKTSTKMNQPHPYLNKKGIRQMDERIEAHIEAFTVLDLIVAEFNSDPMSVQCFDLRTVKRAQDVVERLRKVNPFM